MCWRLFLAPNRLFFRDRCAEDDFQLAVRSLGLGRADAVGAKDGDASSVKGAGGSVKEVEENGGELSRDEGAAPAEKKADLENGPIVAKSDGEDGRAAAAVASGTTSGKPALSPAEHPLQKAITSLDMALGELNQLVHLIDLARAGEFMALARVTPSEEDQARAMPDQSVSGVLWAYNFSPRGFVFHLDRSVDGFNRVFHFFYKVQQRSNSDPQDPGDYCTNGR